MSVRHYTADGALKTENTVTGIYALDQNTTAKIVSNTTTETSIYSVTIPAGDLGTSGMVRVVLSGILVNNSGTGKTITTRVKLGSTTLWDAGSSNIATDADDRGWRMEVEVYAAGSRASQRSAGSWDLGTAVAATTGSGTPASSPILTPWVGEDSTEDSTQSLLLDVTVELSAADANYSLTRTAAHAILTRG